MAERHLHLNGLGTLTAFNLFLTGGLDYKTLLIGLNKYYFLYD